MSESFEISVETAGAPVVSTGVSEQMRAIKMVISASSVLNEEKLDGDGSDTQIQSKLTAASAAAAAEVPAVGATAFGESAPTATNLVFGQGNVL